MKKDSASKEKTLDKDLQGFSDLHLLQNIAKIRAEIRWHRDQLGDDRCWLDDVKVYSNLPEYVNPFKFQICTKNEFLDRCESFFDKRQNPKEKKEKEEAERTYNDADLTGLDHAALLRESQNLRDGIRLHLSKGNKLNWDDDVKLYSLLPERTKPVTSLPKRNVFLNSCKKFYESRGTPPSLHSW